MGFHEQAKHSKRFHSSKVENTLAYSLGSPSHAPVHIGMTKSGVRRF